MRYQTSAEKDRYMASLMEKWQPILDIKSGGAIKDSYKRAVTALVLENTEYEQRTEAETLGRGNFLSESAPTNNYGGGNIAHWDPILIALVRRAMPNLIAYDVCGVQPMTGPVGLIFYQKSRYTSQTGTEALFNEADSTFSGNNAGQNLSGQNTTGTVNNEFGTGFPPITTNFGPGTGGSTGTGFTTAQSEALGDGTSGNNFAEMAFTIDKVTVTAKSRALMANYSTEIAQDLKAVHGLNAEDELANILSAEILTEINRELVRTLYWIALTGCQAGTATAGTFDLDVDSNGRWLVEKYKGLMMQVEREANAIAKTTRRGRGNMIICSSDVASALEMAGTLDYSTAISSNLNVDDTGNTFVGVLNGKYRVFVDPYFISQGTDELLMVGYKGNTPYDAGFFYCPYVPLQMVRAVIANAFQPQIGFKTRYGVVENPFWAQSNGVPTANGNPFYRLSRISNIL